MKLIISPLRYDVILGKNWKNKHKATTDCSNSHVNFEHAGNKCIIHANETIKETSLGSLVNGYKNGCPMLSILLRNDNDSYNVSVNKNAGFSQFFQSIPTYFRKNYLRVFLQNEPMKTSKFNSKKEPSQSRKICTECPTLN